MLATSISASNCLNGWVYGVAAEGTFVKSHDMSDLPTGNSGIPTGWIVEDDIHDYSLDYLTFRALEDGTFNYSKYGTGNNLEYSIDSGTTWVSLASNTNSPTVASGDTIMWRGNLTATSESGSARFSSTCRFEAEGNAFSIIYGDNFTGNTEVNQKDMFRWMFGGNNKIVSAENLSLPATEFKAESPYLGMFSGCTALTVAPQLPATKLTTSCYNVMFENCTSLTKAPDLLAEDLYLNSYVAMFRGCTNLNYIKMLAKNVAAEGCLGSWVQGVQTTSGTFIKDANVIIPTGTSGIPTNWTVQEVGHDYASDYLTFVAQENVTFTYVKLGSGNNLEYSLDNGSTWTSLAPSTASPTVTSGDRILWRGNITPTTEQGSAQFNSSGRYEIEGNVFSVINANGFTGLTTAPAFSCLGMFQGNTGLTSAENLQLPATTMGGKAPYANMFSGCTSLTTAPILPAKTLGTYCYSRMFQDCRSLTKAPTLDAFTLTTGSYKNMFNGCSSLNYIKMIASAVSATECTTSWVQGVAANGTFSKRTATSISTGVNGIPSGWTVRNGYD